MSKLFRACSFKVPFVPSPIYVQRTLAQMGRPMDRELILISADLDQLPPSHSTQYRQQSHHTHHLARLRHLTAAGHVRRHPATLCVPSASFFTEVAP